MPRKKNKPPEPGAPAPVRLAYENWKGVRVERVVVPRALARHGGGHALVCYDPVRNVERVFPIAQLYSCGPAQ